MKTKLFLYSFCLIFSIVLPIRATDHLKPVMEPYEISGTRIVFTNWFYVRAGHFSWLDEKGNKVNTDPNAMIDEYSARFVSKNIESG